MNRAPTSLKAMLVRSVLTNKSSVGFDYWKIESQGFVDDFFKDITSRRQRCCQPNGIQDFDIVEKLGNCNFFRKYKPLSG